MPSKQRSIPPRWAKPRRWLEVAGASPGHVHGVELRAVGPGAVAHPRGLVEHDLDALRDRRLQRGVVADVPSHERRSRGDLGRRLVDARVEGVEDDDLVPAIEQGVDDVAPHEAGPSGHHRAHEGRTEARKDRDFPDAELGAWAGHPERAEAMARPDRVSRGASGTTTMLRLVATGRQIGANLTLLCMSLLSSVRLLRR